MEVMNGARYGVGIQSFQVHHPPSIVHVHLPGNSPNRCLGVFIEASLSRYDWLDHWPLVINSIPSSSLPRGRRWGWMFWASNESLVFLGTSPIPRLSRGHQKSPHYNKWCSSHACHSGNSRGFSSVAGNGDRDKYFSMRPQLQQKLLRWNSHNILLTIVKCTVHWHLCLVYI